MLGGENVACAEFARTWHGTPMTIESARTLDIQSKQHARERALLSAFVPGLGQLAQHRFVAASIQFGTVASYLGGVLALGGQRALVLAVLWNIWSVIDAYRHEAD